MAHKIQIEAVAGEYNVMEDFKKGGGIRLIGAPPEEFYRYITRIVKNVANGGEPVELVYTKGLGKNFRKNQQLCLLKGNKNL